jgi:chaperonin GroEL
MSLSHRKIKSVAKESLAKNSVLDARILTTMKSISDIVGATLGPGGCPVLIERQEYNMPNMITKDGVTVFSNLGYNNPIEHSVMEAARDAAIRTATEAGDGTTTATVLAEAFVRYTHQYVKNHPTHSPQRIVRNLEKIFKTVIEPKIKDMSITPTRELLKAVAKCSANGDVDLADAVMRCFDLAGDEGNITILEKSGPSEYLVEAIKGYPVSNGYEDSCRRFFPVFINDKSNNRVYLENVLFVLYYGKLTEIQSIFNITDAITTTWQNDRTTPYNIVICATEFSESVLASLASNWADKNSINVYPLLIPQSPTLNGTMEIMQDLQAITGSVIYDSVTNPIEKGDYSGLGKPLTYFEANRFRSNLVGCADEVLLETRVAEVKQTLKTNVSELEKRLIDERIGKLTGGIAKLTVVGASSGEIREKKDRADDAACGIRGSRKNGCLPGGGWALVKLIKSLQGTNDAVIEEVLIPALKEPIKRLMSNVGLNEAETNERFEHLYHNNDSSNQDSEVWDGSTDKFVSAVEAGIVDSVPAVLEALRNSISIATLLGTLGGIVVFKRDDGLERQEASETYEFMRQAGMPPVDGG